MFIRKVVRKLHNSHTNQEKKVLLLQLNKISSMKVISRIAALTILLIALSAWGDLGHTMISLRAELSFNENMELFRGWETYLSEHASDPDWRKKDDPSEGPKHYIDIDNYEMFVAEGRIPQTLDSCESMYGADFVEDNGYLPWATRTSYDSLVACLASLNWDRAKYFAADLGHYVADGHMPLHLTNNYDGQLSNNKGIHYRYEIEMIDYFNGEIDYTGWPAEAIDDVNQYIFDYIYKNYPYKDSILIADNSAKIAYPGSYSFNYYSVLWDNTRDLTVMMFRNASHALAELLYTAWIEAGRPGEVIIDPGEETNTSVYIHPKKMISFSPNPSSSFTHARFAFPDNNITSASLIGINGKSYGCQSQIQSLDGQSEIRINTSRLEEGTYCLLVQGPQSTLSGYFMVSR